MEIQSKSGLPGSSEMYEKMGRWNFGEAQPEMYENMGRWSYGEAQVLGFLRKRWASIS
jgi:hypothetical protein